MEKVQVGDRNTLDYIAAAKWINDVLGFEQRDAHVYFYPMSPLCYDGLDIDGQQDDGQYLDYWHYALDRFFGLDNVENDHYVRGGPYSFVDFYQTTLIKYGEMNWRTHIAKVWANEYPGCYRIWFSW
jgi:hypothetical protein